MKTKIKKKDDFTRTLEVIVPWDSLKADYQKYFKDQSRKYEISGKNNTYYCGAYWRNGFHEDGVISGLDVCKSFGESL